MEYTRAHVVRMARKGVERPRFPSQRRGRACRGSNTEYHAVTVHTFPSGSGTMSRCTCSVEHDRGQVLEVIGGAPAVVLEGE